MTRLAPEPTRCPGFLHGSDAVHHQPIWKLLEEWIAEEHFARARADGWFDAMTYYAYKDVRMEQAWSLWERSKADWIPSQPARRPKFDQWKLQMASTYMLAQDITEEARVVGAMESVNRNKLHTAVAEVVGW